MKKYLSRATWFMFVSLLITSLTLMSCSSAATTTSTATATVSTQPTSASPELTSKSGGVLRVVASNITQVFGYPGDMGSAGSPEVSSPCVESLCGVDAKGFFSPNKLSTGYQVTPDGKTMTFALRKGVKFHDGTDFNAQAVKWSLDISKKKRLAGTETWTSIDVVDDYTIQFNLKQYTNNILYQLESACGLITSPAAFEKFGEAKIHTNPVGTGPFMFESFTPDVEITYKRFDDYWGGTPYLDKIKFIFIKEDNARSAAMQAGEVDILMRVNTETGVVLRDKGFDIGRANQAVTCLYPDSANADSPLANPKVRQAIEYAIDRDALKELGNGFWDAANQPSTPETPGYVSNLEGRPYDTNKAKQLLAEAGYPDGLELNLIFDTNIMPSDGAVALQQYLSKVGITLDLQMMTSVQQDDFIRNGWKNGFIAFRIFGGPGYVSGIQFSLSPNGNVFVSVQRPTDFGEYFNQALAAIDEKDIETAGQKLNMSLYDSTTVIPLVISYRNLFVQQNYVHDTNLFKGGAVSPWTPAKAWLSN